MSISFKKNCSLIFVFTHDLTKVILKEQDGKLDGFAYENPQGEIPEVKIIQAINLETGLELQPDLLRIVTTLQNINKLWKIDVYMTCLPEPVQIKTEFKYMETDKLDNTCHPNLKWLIPLCTDLSVYRSGFNQILMS